MSEIEDRRQRARDAFYKAMEVGTSINMAAPNAAITTATQVKLTPEMIKDVRVKAGHHPAFFRDFAEAIIRSFCEMNGFEVIEHSFYESNRFEVIE